MWFVLQVPYNVERILFIASNGDKKRIAEIMTDFEAGEMGTQIPMDLVQEVRKIIVGKLNWKIVFFFKMFLHVAITCYRIHVC